MMVLVDTCLKFIVYARAVYSKGVYLPSLTPNVVTRARSFNNSILFVWRS